MAHGLVDIESPPTQSDTFGLCFRCVCWPCENMPKDAKQGLLCVLACSFSAKSKQRHGTTCKSILERSQYRHMDALGLLDFVMMLNHLHPWVR